MNKLKFILALIILGSLAAAGCSSNDESAGAKLKIAVTIAPQQGIVEAVAGELAEVVTLVPKGASPETYEATARQIEEFSQANVYFTLGLPSESAKVIPDTGGTLVVDLGAVVSDVYPDRTFDGADRDPHIWLSPKRVMVMVREIAVILSELDPANEETYARNADDYLHQLEALDTEIMSLMNARQQKKLIIYHPSLGYFAEDYGLEMFALEEEGKEADAAHLKELVDFAKAEGLKAVFATDEAETRQIEAFAEEIGGKVISLKALESEYIGSMKKLAQAIAGAY